MASQDGTPAVTRERTSFAVVHARLPEQFGWQPAKLRRRSCGTTILEGAWELAQDNSVTPARPAKPGTAATLSIGIGGMVGGGMFAITGLAVGIARGAGTDAFLIASVVVGHLQFAEVAEASDFALSRAAREFSGNTGYFAIAVAALLATTSAINATFCGSGKFACFVSRTACSWNVHHCRARPCRGQPCVSGGHGDNGQWQGFCSLFSASTLPMRVWHAKQGLEPGCQPWQRSAQHLHSSFSVSKLTRILQHANTCGYWQA